MGFGEGGPSWRQTEPSRFLGDLPPELVGLPGRPVAPARPAARAPLVRRHPGALPGDPHIELDADDAPARPAAAPRAAPRGEPTVDYSFDQRSDAGPAGFRRGERVRHASLGEGVVLSCEGPGRDAKVTVVFELAGEKRVLARFLAPAG
jgi:DNA helicase-2/ATP-dependent DNA helicase PcrA